MALWSRVIINNATGYDVAAVCLEWTTRYRNIETNVQIVVNDAEVDHMSDGIPSRPTTARDDLLNSVPHIEHRYMCYRIHL
jgi:hypothetical protein